MLMLIISSLSILSKLVFSPLDISQSFFFPFLSYNVILFPPLPIFAPLALISLMWLFYCSFVPIFSLFLFFSPNLISHYSHLTPGCTIPYLFYLRGKFHFLLCFAFFLFPTLIICPPPTLSKSFFFLLVASYSSFLSYTIFILFPPL